MKKSSCARNTSMKKLVMSANGKFSENIKKYPNDLKYIVGFFFGIWHYVEKFIKMYIYIYIYIYFAVFQ